MINTTESKVEKVEKKLKFYVELSLFFPVIVKGFLEFSGSLANEIIRTDLMVNGLTVFLSIINLLVFYWLGEKSSSRSLDYLNWIYTILISSMATIILTIGIIANSALKEITLGSIIWITLSISSFILLVALPFVSVLIIFINNLINTIKKKNLNNKLCFYLYNIFRHY